MDVISCNIIKSREKHIIQLSPLQIAFHAYQYGHGVIFIISFTITPCCVVCSPVARRGAASRDAAQCAVTLPSSTTQQHVQHRYQNSVIYDKHLVLQLNTSYIIYITLIGYNVES